MQVIRFDNVAKSFTKGKKTDNANQIKNRILEIRKIKIKA